MTNTSKPRTVLNLDPALKSALYGKLLAEGITLSAWFRGQAQAYLGLPPSKAPRGHPMPLQAIAKTVGEHSNQSKPAADPFDNRKFDPIDD